MKSLACKLCESTKI